MAGCEPSNLKAPGCIPSTRINQVWRQRPVNLALRRLSDFPEVTQLARGKERSQRALSWVPLALPTRHAVSSRRLLGWRTERRREDVENRQRGKKAKIHPLSMKLRAGGQSQGEHQRLGAMCAWQLGITLEKAYFLPTRSSPKLPTLSTHCSNHPRPDTWSLEGQERRGAQTPGGGGARTLAQSTHGGQTFPTLLTWQSPATRQLCIVTESPRPDRHTDRFG